MLQKYPFLFQLGIATIKTSTADLMVQKYIEKKDIDYHRNKVFTIFGFTYLGCAQYVFYVKWMNKLFPSVQNFAKQSLRLKLRNPLFLAGLVGQVCFDAFFLTPFLYFPSFYTLKEYLDSESNKNTTNLIKNGLTKYKKNFWEDNKNYCMLWLPINLGIYVLPIYLRLPAVHTVSFCWTGILSYTRGK